MTTANSITQIEIEHAKVQPAFFNVHTRRWMGDTLFATDMVSLATAIFIALQARNILFTRIELPYIEFFLLLGATNAYLFLRRGLYPPVGMHYADELRNIVTTVTLAFLIIVGVTFVFKTTVTYSRLVLILTWVLCLPLIPLNRYLIRRLLIRLGLWGESVVFVGDLQKAQSMAVYFKARLQYGILPVAVFSDKPNLGEPSVPCPNLPLCRVKVFSRNLSVKTGLIFINDLNDLGAVVKRYRDAFQWLILINGKYDNFGLTFLKPLDFMDILGLQVKNNLLSNSSQVPKRIMDVVISFLGLLFLAPLLTFIAILIKWESGGGVFYRQQRLGKDGQKFNLLKFRTMYQNADVVFKEALAHDPVLKVEWDEYQKVKNDPRITRVGRLLRKFSLDELPQLWNVLKGEMGLVGPRPIMVNQRELYGETIKEYFEVAPGMTGLWQVSGRNQTTFARRVELDLEYIQRWSIWLDIYILLKTIKVVILLQGSY